MVNFYRWNITSMQQNAVLQLPLFEQMFALCCPLYSQRFSVSLEWESSANALLIHSLLFFFSD